MKTLLITVGVPGCGKSTWIKEQGLEQYAICPDKIRLLFSSPTMDLNGNFVISQKKDNKVWKLVFELIEQRMEKGMFTILDATNINKDTIATLDKLCSKYGFRFFAKRFDVPLNELLVRNSNRDSVQQVPEEVIKKMFDRLQTFESKKFKLIDNINETNEIVRLTEINNENIYVIGDVHGCYNELKEFFKDKDLQKDFFIFTGDYIDRGNQNAEVMNFLVDFIEKDNFIFLEGNHERWLRCWLDGSELKSLEFANKTLPQLEANCDKNKIHSFTRRLRSFVKFKSGIKTFIVCHGGIPNYDFDFISTSELINGVGKYEETSAISKQFVLNCFANVNEFETYLIHGHRNVEELPIQVNERVYNLEGQVEFGGFLRAVKISNDTITPIEIKSSVKNDFLDNVIYNRHEIKMLRNSKLVKEKKLSGDMSSFNFTRDAFNSKSWNNQTIKARGLFIRNDGKIIARSYEKFFNVNENKETAFDNLQHKFSFPVFGFDKENGYLGILGYDDFKDDFVFCSKSTNDGDFANWFKDLFYDKFNEKQVAKIKQYIKENDCTFVWEVVLPELDPHIIEYKQDCLILLDAFDNTFKTNKKNYFELSAFAESCGIEIKKLHSVTYNWEQFCEVFETAKHEKNEGVVYEDSNGFYVKQKTDFYNKWKTLRGFITAISKNPNVKITKHLDQEEFEFLKWLRTQENFTEDSIISLRNRFNSQKV